MPGNKRLYSVVVLVALDSLLVVSAPGILGVLAARRTLSSGFVAISGLGDTLPKLL